jgi:hypothetical protein
MKEQRGFILALAVTGLVAAGLEPARAQAAGVGEIERDECARLARQKRAVEAGGMRDLLARSPGEVAREGGPATLQKMRDYIELREAVLFRCPPNVLNATAAPLDERLKAAPVLPGKGPRRARPAVERRSQPVPLPTQRPI